MILKSQSRLPHTLHPLRQAGLKAFTPPRQCKHLRIHTGRLAQPDFLAGICLQHLHCVLPTDARFAFTYPTNQTKL